MGRRLGFPTANLALPKEACGLPFGVYLCTLTLEDGRSLKGILNQGHHPTLPDGIPTVEVHLLAFDGNLYGEVVTVCYLDFVRPEQRLDSPEALRERVLADIAQAERYFMHHPQEASHE